MATDTCTLYFKPEFCSRRYARKKLSSCLHLEHLAYYHNQLVSNGLPSDAAVQWIRNKLAAKGWSLDDNGKLMSNKEITEINNTRKLQATFRISVNKLGGYILPDLSQIDCYGNCYLREMSINLYLDQRYVNTRATTGHMLIKDMSGVNHRIQDSAMKITGISPMKSNPDSYIIDYKITSFEIIKK